jgi:TRAP transporter T-component
MKVIHLFVLIFVVSCGSVQRMGIRGVSPILKKGGDFLTHERNWEFFRDSTPGNLKFLELLYLQDPSNSDLLGLIIKGYAGYAFAVPETMYFGDELAGVEDSKWKKESIDFYTRAFDYGLKYLEIKNIDPEKFFALEDEKLNKEVKDKFDEDDIVPILYFAQSWGSLINLQKDNIALVAQVPKVKILFDWVCDLKPEIDHGVCDIFYAQYEASRPKMLGGDPVKAEKLYLEAMNKRPHHLLVRVGYLQYLVLPAYDAEKYAKISEELKVELEKWQNLSRENLKSSSEYRKDSELNLYNAIAKKRLEMIETHKKNIF